jgi:hypothetical protein
MRLKIYRQFGALNSQAVFDAFSHGIQQLGHEIVEDNEDVAVIWSVLWQGRMMQNQAVYRAAKADNKPVMILEVGNLVRGSTWRVSIDNINGRGKFANQTDLDYSRPSKLKVNLKPNLVNRRSEILIASQHSFSLQWEGMPSMEQWIQLTVNKIKQYSDREIVVRPHPRSPIHTNIPGVKTEIPQRVPNTYDGFNIDYNYHCVINHNSGPAVQAAIEGAPIICDESSLAGSISEKWENLENPVLPDRQEWFVQLCHTEWLLKELAQGIPQSRLIETINP